MAGCPIDDAFEYPDGMIARKEERRRAKKCGGPALAFLKAGGEGNSLDPDRQHLTPPPQAKLLNGSYSQGSEHFTSDQQSSNTQWIPKQTTPQQEKQNELVSNLIGQHVNDVIGQKSRNTLPTNIESNIQLPDPSKNTFGTQTADYFGKSLDSTEAYADFSASLKDTAGYTLTQKGQADFMGSFAASNLNKATGVPTLSTPQINDAWKPLTPGGARSSFTESFPFPQLENGAEVKGSFDKQAIMSKIDTLFARLEEIESKKNENAHIEISLFVLSGLFLMYGIDSLRRF